MALYRKKPVEIEARQFSGENYDEIIGWINADRERACASFMLEGNGRPTPELHTIHLETLEGTMIARPGDFIICGVEGEFYPCKPDIFHKTYDEVE